MRARLRFSKLGKVRWTSHRDVARMWERAFRRVQLPLAYTQGFSPRPKVSFGLALPTGAESVAEYLDVELAPEGAAVDVAALPALLTPVLPVGIDVLAAAVIDDRADSLQHEVTSCAWRVEVLGVSGVDEMRDLVARALAADSLVVTRERKGRQSDDDLRPGILSVTVAGLGEMGVVLECELAAAPRALRPSELLRALGPGLEEAGVRRTHQWILRDGARSEPLMAPVDATDAPPAPSLERAS